MIGYFASIPKELDEAALMDGANYRQILTRVFIPVALPGLIAATIFAFTVSWAQFLYPLAFTTSADQLVLPVGIVTTLIKGDVFNWGQIMTGALLGAMPPLVIYVFLMDYYIAGLTAGARKGEVPRGRVSAGQPAARLGFRRARRPGPRSAPPPPS